jgi:transketolase
MDAVQQAKSGHPGMPMGMADIATVLFSEFLCFDADDPYWHDRDRSLISNGHGSMLLYGLLYPTGVKDMPIEQISFFGNNAISIDGATSLTVSDDQTERLRAAHWYVQEIDGHDTDAIREAQAVTDRPSMISCRTIIGFGLPTKAGTQKAHSDAPGEGEIADACEALGWAAPPFVIPENLLEAWRTIGAKGRETRLAWASRVKQASDGLRQDFERRTRGDLPDGWRGAIAAAKREVLEGGKELATRQASGAVLNHLFDAIPELLGGSADLTPSNNTKAKNQVEIRPSEYKGSYVHCGVREHGMAAAMNGVALHGGLIPYGGTFLTFSDYCRPAIRLAAKMAPPISQSNNWQRCAPFPT